MAGKNTAVFGLFPTVSQAEQAVDVLIDNGFRSDDVSVLAPDQQTTKDFAAEKNTKAPEGTTTGATAGGAIGGTLGLLAGIGALAIPGLGPFIAAGPIMGALAGLGAGAATGGIIGALVGMGIPEYEAKRYEGHLKDGGVLLSVHCDDSDWVGKAKDILQRAGAQDVASAGEKAVSTHTADSDRVRGAVEGSSYREGTSDTSGYREVDEPSYGNVADPTYRKM